MADSYSGGWRDVRESQGLDRFMGFEDRYDDVEPLEVLSDGGSRNYRKSMDDFEVAQELCEMIEDRYNETGDYFVLQIIDDNERPLQASAVMRNGVIEVNNYGEDIFYDDLKEVDEWLNLIGMVDENEPEDVVNDVLYPMNIKFADLRSTRFPDLEKVASDVNWSRLNGSYLFPAAADIYQEARNNENFFK